jgi:hypothetical protein
MTARAAALLVLFPCVSKSVLAQGPNPASDPPLSQFATDVTLHVILHELEAVVRQFDWHSQVTIRFTEGDGGAAWSRSGRTITVHGGYVRRFIEQGESIADVDANPESPPRD